MSDRTATREAIVASLKDFDSSPLAEAARLFFATLGYKSDRTLPLTTPRQFRDQLDPHGKLTAKECEAISKLSSLHLLFQLTESELGSQANLFEKPDALKATKIESYLFFAAELPPGSYTRTVLATLVRAVNKPLPMPALLLFKHGANLTLAVIDRRLSKKDQDKDVLRKVTLIKDIRTFAPHRAHVEILYDLSLSELFRIHGCRSFVDLHNAWRKTLDISALNNRFYKELSNWYFWASDKVSFPDDIEKSAETRNASSLIRLLTRVIFVWFLREKNLVPEKLFDRRELPTLLKGFLQDSAANTFYPAVLQNLFFGTLNQTMGERRFAAEGSFHERRRDHGVMNLYRHKEAFAIAEEEALALFTDIPFLNGGLFDCLDKEDEAEKVRYIDGFSRNPDKQAIVPDMLFFSEEQDADLNVIYGTRGKQYKVKGLIDILLAYKFTVAENTPVEEEVALDPELLGKVFENLLASYNPETRETARNRTGSFYTPREIVEYMVDESLKSFLSRALCENAQMREEDARAGLEILFAYTEKEHAFSASECHTLIEAIDTLKIIDPACGSGAFPMGILHKLVFLLHKLDPKNEEWKERQRLKAANIDDPVIREQALNTLEEAFANNELDYGRKLYLIENCIFGVDIQPIAVQIAKLRFFISLVIDQEKQTDKENLGILALPNLETKFVAADSLIELDKKRQDQKFDSPEIKATKQELKDLRHRYFGARNRKEKLTCQKRDRELRTHLAGYLVRLGWERDIAGLIAAFDPYDQNASAPFFDPEWMFGHTAGFDVVLGNPPYIQIQSFSGKPEQKRWEEQNYCVWAKTGDLYCLFYERGFGLLRDGGFLCYITSNKWMRANYGKALRHYMLANGSLTSLIDFGDSPIFENATTYTNILLWRQAKATTPPLAYDLSRAYATESTLPELLDKQGAGEALFSAESFVLASGAQAKIKQRIEQVGTPLRNWGIAINYGIKTGLNEAFVIDSKKRDEMIAADPRSAEILKPVLRGRDIKRYKAEWAGLWLVATFPALHLDIEQYPAVRDYLKTFGNSLEQSGERGCRKKTCNQWFEVQDTIAYYAEFGKEKVIWLEMAQDRSFLLDRDSLVCINTAYIMTGKHLGYLIAVLNSQLIDMYFSMISTNIQGNTRRFIKQYVELIPIPKIPLAERAPFAILVDYIQYAHAHGLGTEAKTLEGVVNLMVYGLYFEEEMKIAQCYINTHLAATLEPFPADGHDDEKVEAVQTIARRCQDDETLRYSMAFARTVEPVKVVQEERSNRE